MDKRNLSRTASLDLKDPKENKRLTKGFSQPKRTIEYKVCTSDSLQSVALHFNTTPSELSRLNHLYGQTLFPGQKLYVPDPSEDEPPCLSPTTSTFHSSLDQSTPLLDLPIVRETPQDIPMVHQRPKHVSPAKQSSERATPPRKPGRAVRQGSGDLPPEGGAGAGARQRPPLVRQGSNSRDVVNPLDTEYCEKFLKINCKHITKGQGVVSGVLLVTPNCIMFDPNVSDPLVVEHGADTYGMLAPMETIISSSMYQDTSKMIDNMSPREYSCNMKDFVSPEVYRPASVSSNEDGSLPSTEPIAKSSRTAESLLDSPENHSGSSSPVKPAATADLSPPGNAAATPGRPEPSSPPAESGHSQCQESQAGPKESGDSEHSATNPSPGETVGSAESGGPPTAPTLSGSGSGSGRGGGGQRPEVQSSASASIAATTAASTIAASAAGDAGSPAPDTVTGTATAAANTMAPAATNTTAPAAANTTAPAPARTDSSASIGILGGGGVGGAPHLLSQTPPRTSFVDFSCGYFVKEQDPANQVMDISEAIRDSSASQLEIERIKSSARRIRLSMPRRASRKQLQQTESLDSWKINFKDLLPKKTYAVEEPLYLCLRIGKPKTSAYSSSGGVFESYSKKRKPEYWFAVPRDRADHLYAFFVQWSPNIYGKDDIDPEELGFVVIEEENGEPLELVDGYFEEPVAKDWEIVTVQEARRRVSLWEVMNNLPLPDLIGESTILETENIATLCKNLPPRVEGYSWTLIYSTMQHGFSLKTLYRSMGRHESPVLLVIKDSDGYIFGALASCPFKVSDHFYGTGETFLFKFTPEFIKYGWSGDNTFFIKGDMDCLALGGGSGIFGLWLDGDLYHGHSKPCSTFNNDIVSAKEDFVVEELEAWGFE